MTDPRSELSAVKALKPRERTAIAIALEQAMSDFSELCWCAGWLNGTEFEVWDVIRGERTEWGQMSVRARQFINQSCQIRALAVQGKCWIVHLDEVDDNGYDWAPVDIHEWMVAVRSKLVDQDGNCVVCEYHPNDTEVCGNCHRDVARNELQDAPAQQGGQAVDAWCEGCLQAYNKGITDELEVYTNGH